MRIVPTDPAAAGSPTPAAPVPRSPGGVASGPAPGPRAAIVDDNHALRATIGELLTDAGIQVVAEATDGIHALRTIPPAACGAPLVVLMDLRMPGPINGIETTRLLLDRCDHVAVVIFTAFPGLGIEQAARRAGAVDLLVKGAPADTVIAAIRQAWTGMVRDAG